MSNFEWCLEGLGQQSLVQVRLPGGDLRNLTLPEDPNSMYLFIFFQMRPTVMHSKDIPLFIYIYDWKTLKYCVVWEWYINSEMTFLKKIKITEYNYDTIGPSYISHPSKVRSLNIILVTVINSARQSTVKYTVYFLQRVLQFRDVVRMCLIITPSCRLAWRLI